MSRKKKTKEYEVEWLDEECTGHYSIEESKGEFFVEVRVSGSVMIDGKEYILDEVIGDLPVYPCNIGPNGEILNQKEE